MALINGLLKFYRDDFIQFYYSSYDGEKQFIFDARFRAIKQFNRTHTRVSMRSLNEHVPACNDAVVASSSVGLRCTRE